VADVVLLGQVDHQFVLAFQDVQVVINLLLSVVELLGVRIGIELLLALKVEYLLFQILDLRGLLNIEFRLLPDLLLGRLNLNLVLFEQLSEVLVRFIN